MYQLVDVTWVETPVDINGHSYVGRTTFILHYKKI